jgi:WD40 repeat protein
MAFFLFAECYNQHMRRYWHHWMLIPLLVACSTPQTLTLTPLPTFTPSPIPPTATPVPAEGRVFFSSSQGDIFAMNPDGTYLQAVFASPGIDRFPSVSHDGEWLAFQSDLDGDNEIYLLNLETRALKQITENGFNDLQPGISPDGAWVVFASDRDGSSDIWSYQLSTGQFRQLTDLPGAESSPQFSGSGDSILFMAEQDGVSELYLIDLDGGDQMRLTNNDAHETAPFWTEDGGIGYIDLVASTIHFLDANGRPRGAQEALPSPDIVLQLSSSQFGQIVISQADGGNASLQYRSGDLDTLLAEDVHPAGVFWSAIPAFTIVESWVHTLSILPAETSPEKISLPELIIEADIPLLDSFYQITFTHLDTGYQVHQFETWGDGIKQRIQIELPRKGTWLVDIFIDGQFMQNIGIIIE